MHRLHRFFGQLTKSVTNPVRFWDGDRYDVIWPFRVFLSARKHGATGNPPEDSVLDRRGARAQ